MRWLVPGSSKKTAIARVVPRHRLNPLYPNFNVVGSGSVSAAFRKNSHSGRYMSGDQSATLSWGHTGDSRNLFIPDLMAVFFEEPGEIFFGNVDRRHAISIVNTTCDNLTKGAPLHVFFAVSTVAVFGTCYTLYSCHATDSQLTVNSQSTRQSTRALFLTILKQNARCVRKL